MSHTRASRRHHRKRLIARRLKEHNHFYRVFPLSKEEELKRAAKRTKTAAACSCSMCGNPRNHYGNSLRVKTWQERRSDYTLQEETAG